MKKMFLFLGLLVMIYLLPTLSWATPVLYDWSIDVDGTLYQSPGTYMAPAPDGDITSISGFPWFSTTDPYSGDPYDGPEAVGTITLTFEPCYGGLHHVEGYFDVEIDSYLNTWFNETGTAHGTATGGVDGYADYYDPAFVDPNDNPADDPDDIIWVMDWDFSLAYNQDAILTYYLTADEPSSSFYLSQSDIDSNETVYLYSTLEIRDRVCPIPEPGTILLVGSGLLGIVGLAKGRRGR
jgi:hypothetical protein